MEGCPRNAVEPRHFPSIPRRGMYRLWVSGFWTVSDKKLAATGASSYSIYSLRTAKMEILRR